jgi:outer membrane protein assembly factor BamA
LSRRTVLAWRVKGGVIVPETFNLSGQDARYVPPDQRFYAGGPNTVRGFRLNDLGPRVYVTPDTINFRVEPNGDTLYTNVRASPTGGNTLFLTNAELRFPSPLWPQFVRLGLFVDVGQLYQRGEDVLSVANFRMTPGIGVRVATPLGPVRLDLAYNGYATEQGTLYYENAAGDLEEIPGAYPPSVTAPRNFMDRLILQLAVGQAF